MAKRTVKFYKHYFQEFFIEQSPQVRKKNLPDLDMGFYN